jgi:hypothetical protein
VIRFLTQSLSSFLRVLWAREDWCEQAVRRHGHGNGECVWGGGLVFYVFYEADGGEGAQRDDDGRLRDDGPCFCWVLFFEGSLFRDLLLVMRVSVT